MRTRALSMTLLCAAISVACSSSSDTPDDAGDAGTDAAPPPDSAPTPFDVGPDAAPPTPTLALTALTAQNVGRSGTILRLVVKGSDTKKQTAAVFVRFLDAADVPVIAVDTNFDGKPDASEKRFRFWDPTTLGLASFTGTLMIPGVFGPSSTIAKVVVALEDVSGGRSSALSVPIALQPVRAAAEDCDPKELANRCAPHLSCSGSPSTCQPGVAPLLTKVIYYGGSNPHMIFLGTEPDEDMKHIEIEFLDSTGTPKPIDIFNDGNPVTSFVTVVRQAMADPTFYTQFVPTLGFDTTVPKISATPVDSLLHKGTPIVAQAGPVPIRTLGQDCDFRDFDVCVSGNVCAPGFATTKNTCQGAATLRSKACAAAPVIDPAKGVTKAFGVAQGPSLWDVPTGCELHNLVGVPEGIVSLHLAKSAASLTISTAVPETDFDTIVYLLPGCAGNSSGALGCADDSVGYSSVLSLKNVAAGDYVIVVDSLQKAGGHFGVTVDAK